jgi:ubiquitin-protein ligase
MATNENVNLAPKVLKELARELKNLDDTPPEDIKVHVNEENFSNITADIEGPLGTPYEGGVFRMKLILSNDFPDTPPKGYFVTRIFHPNVAKNGEICVNTLKKDWKPTLGLRHVLLVQSYPLSGLLYFFEIWQNAYYRPFHAVSDFCLRVVCKKYTTCVPFSIFMELFMFGALISVLL